MELKSFIRTLKMQRGRYTKNPNAEAEKKTIENLAEKIGGKLEAIAQLKEAGEEELKSYIKDVLGIKTVVANVEDTDTNVEKTTDASSTIEKKKVGRPKKDDKQYGRDEKGNLYEIDKVKKTCKKVYKDLKDLNYEDLDIPEISLITYQRYLKDKFPGETCTLKKGKLMFRDYRITLTTEDGFTVEDARNHYEAVDTPWEGIPTPAELGEWFKNPTTRELTDAEKIQENIAAIEAGKRHEYERKRERERLIAESEKKREEEEKEEEGIYFEARRRTVLRKIEEIRTKVDTVFNPEGFADMIPFKRWRRQCKSLLTKWKNKDIRYAKFLKELERITIEETFVIKEKNHRSSFKGSLMPEHKKVGYLRGDKLEVDDKLVDAVPFLMDYLLFYEPKAMSQIMKYAKGEITDRELIEEPIKVDWKEEYKKKLLPNTAHNARVLTCVFESCGLIAPQDLLFESDLVPGDVILVYFDGKLRRKTVASVESGVILGKEVGLLKTDKWILAPKKNTD